VPLLPACVECMWVAKNTWWHTHTRPCQSWLSSVRSVAPHVCVPTTPRHVCLRPHLPHTPPPPYCLCCQAPRTNACHARDLSATKHTTNTGAILILVGNVKDCKAKCPLLFPSMMHLDCNTTLPNGVDEAARLNWAAAIVEYNKAPCYVCQARNSTVILTVSVVGVLCGYMHARRACVLCVFCVCVRERESVCVCICVFCVCV